MNPSDPLVQAALAHMKLRKATINTGAPDAGEAAETAFVIASRGGRDPYPAHVFGSQALGWCARATLTPRVRRELLREAKEIVNQSLATHRGRPELQQLANDIRLAELKPA